jgi:hypothetical protein
MDGRARRLLCDGVLWPGGRNAGPRLFCGAQERSLGGNPVGASRALAHCFRHSALLSTACPQNRLAALAGSDRVEAWSLPPFGTFPQTTQEGPAPQPGPFLFAGLNSRQPVRMRRHVAACLPAIVLPLGHGAYPLDRRTASAGDPDTSPDLLRRARCTRCGRKRATLRHPSWANTNVGFEEFPAERAAPVLVSFVN